jgi:hypothetical protein
MPCAISAATVASAVVMRCAPAAVSVSVMVQDVQMI